MWLNCNFSVVGGIDGVGEMVVVADWCAVGWAIPCKMEWNHPYHIILQYLAE